MTLPSWYFATTSAPLATPYAAWFCDVYAGSVVVDESP
jgi:hypothetical protein